MLNFPSKENLPEFVTGLLDLFNFWLDFSSFAGKLFAEEENCI